MPNKLYLKRKSDFLKMKNYCLLLLLLAQNLLAQNQLSIQKIPEKFRQNMDAVIRYDNTELTIESTGKYILKKNWAITIFNEKGEENFATFSVNYDKFSKINKIEGAIFDQTGKELKKLKNNEIKDYSTDGNDAGVTDNRLKIAEFDKKFFPFPYTIVFSYEAASTNMLFLPSWFPIVYENISAESSKFTVICPLAIKYQKKEEHLPNKSKISTFENNRIEEWEITNFTSPELEPYIEEPSVPKVILAPIDFKIDEFRGTANTWAELSTFYHNLNKDRDILTEKTNTEIKELIKNEKNTEQKVKKIYEYMQARTRYQSIQLGIGGWQTRLASEVTEKGYGDCKALTNYTIALLKIANITAYPALIKAGDNETITKADMPKMGFNHVIACVPIEKDTLWLECTSQDNPFGYQGDFTGNRKALLVKPTNGSLVNTTQYTPEQNLLRRKAQIFITDEGNSQIKMNTLYTGIQQEYRSSLYKNKNPVEQKDWLTSRYQLPNIQIIKHSYEKENNKIPKLSETIEITSSKLGSITGKRMFINPNLFSIGISPPLADSNRVNRLYLNPNSENYIDIDSLELQLPANFKIETLPKDFNLKYTFGEYQTNIKKMGENSLIYYRRLKMKAGHYPKEQYAELVDFYKKIKVNDRQRVVLLKKET